MKDDVGEFPASMLREYTRGGLGTEHHNVMPHTVLVSDEDVRELLSHMAHMYDPSAFDETPSTFWETRFAKRVLKNCGTEVANYAVKTGQTEVIDFITGLPNFDADISGIHTINKIREWMTRTAAITLFAGHMGNGKTDFALLLAEVWKWEQDRMGNKHAILSNIQSFKEAETVTSMSELKERIEEDEDEHIHVVWDEASSHASGYGSDRDDVENQLRRFLRMIRKNNGSLTMIGHTKGGKDIHPDVRRLCQAVHKTSKKEATIYREITEAREYDHEKMSLESIPQTSFTYDTDEDSDWTWDLEIEDEEEEIDLEKVWVEQCIAETSDGDRCGCDIDRYDIDQETGTCEHHSIDSEGDLAVDAAEVPGVILGNLPVDAADARAGARLGRGEGGGGGAGNESHDDDADDTTGTEMKTRRLYPSER